MHRVALLMHRMLRNFWFDDNQVWHAGPVDEILREKISEYEAVNEDLRKSSLPPAEAAQVTGAAADAAAGSDGGSGGAAAQGSA